MGDARGHWEGNTSACHEGNRAMENILSAAARAEEEAVRKGLESSTSPVPTAAEGER